MIPASERSDRLITETLEFLRQTFSVRAVMFYWIEPELDTVNDALLGLPEGLAEHYRREMRPYDPLLASRLVEGGKSIAELHSEAKAIPAQDRRRYLSFLGEYNVTGNLEFVFWSGEGQERRAFGGASLLGLEGDPPFTGDFRMIDAIYRYVAFNLQSHERVRTEKRGRMLRERVGLTARECAVCEYVSVGASNQDIADCLGLTLSTVKTYMRQIFDKVGVDTRTALAARLSSFT
ncbi:helix-turn-helix transcriptional regulator [Altererythrobacter fulvus]|uniref:helix-turn-helix transcriptional regulator n=1 Tax=Caenibius fulvus TaxID=2126012 RepID=UPI00301AEA6C